MPATTCSSLFSTSYLAILLNMAYTSLVMSLINFWILSCIIEKQPLGTDGFTNLIIIASDGMFLICDSDGKIC